MHFAETRDIENQLVWMGRIEIKMTFDGNLIEFWFAEAVEPDISSGVKLLDWYKNCSRYMAGKGKTPVTLKNFSKVLPVLVALYYQTTVSKVRNSGEISLQGLRFAKANHIGLDHNQSRT